MVHREGHILRLMCTGPPKIKVAQEGLRNFHPVPTTSPTASNKKRHSTAGRREEIERDGLLCDAGISVLKEKPTSTTSPTISTREHQLPVEEIKGWGPKGGYAQLCPTILCFSL